MAPYYRDDEDESEPPTPSQTSLPHRLVGGRNEKRRRNTQSNSGPAASRRRTASPPSSTPVEDLVYDPDQSLADRRKVQRAFRGLHADLSDRADQFIQPDSTDIRDTLAKANQLSTHVKQTAEAAIDSRLLVQIAELAGKKTANLTKGGLVQGVDVDDFLSRAITYMRQGSGVADDDAADLTVTQRHRRSNANANNNGDNDTEESDDDEGGAMGDDGDMLHWSHYGNYGCLPQSSRPGPPSFLIGPLSVEKKARKVVQVKARFRPDELKQARPQIIEKSDLGKNEKNDLTAMCSKILTVLEDHQEKAQAAVSELSGTATQSAVDDLMDELGLHSIGSLDLLKFVVNPWSFGQTVENLFYVSFLIRDKRVEIDFDDNGFAGLNPISPNDDEDSDSSSGPAAGAGARHQAVFTLDMETWRDVIKSFNIKESIIPHREEEPPEDRGPGAKTWYG